MTKKLVLIAAGVFLLALVAGFVAAVSQGPLDRYTGGDGPYYIGLARAMAAGKGYVLDRSPWPESPHLGRLPLWPVLLTPSVWLFPHAGEFTVLRLTGIFLHGLAALVLALLTYRLFADPAAALLAGVLMAIYPPALALMENGLSEDTFVVLTAAGILLLAGRGWKPAVGALSMGIAVLSRSNFLIFPFLFILAALLWGSRGLRRRWKRAAIMTAVFLTPVSLWMYRNYRVSGAFPLVSALEGEALYGANNSVVAGDLRLWGYWVFPDLIPGETPKQQLGKRMSEADLNRYYRQKGIDYIRDNWSAYPRLVLGKLVRGFVPVPWVPLTSSYLAFLARLLLYLAFFVSWRSGILQNESFRLFLAALLGLTLITTVIFYGTFRFTFCLEVFLIPCVAAWLVQRWRRVSSGFRVRDGGSEMDARTRVQGVF